MNDEQQQRIARAREIKSWHQPSPDWEADFDQPESHVTPEPNEPPHDLDGLCWCQPLAERQPAGGTLYVHRRSLDHPHIEGETR